MLARHEYNAVYKLIEEYTEAWEEYVRATAQGHPSRFEKGVKVNDTKERLFKLLNELR